MGWESKGDSTVLALCMCNIHAQIYSHTAYALSLIYWSYQAGCSMFCNDIHWMTLLFVCVCVCASIASDWTVNENEFKHTE